MSRLFGPLRQMGFVVRDIDRAMRHWVEVCGIGPWFLAEKLPLDAFWYKEQRYDDIHLTIALANSGDVQLELIQQRDEKPSMYRDFLAAGREGLQHWSSWPENYHRCRAHHAAARGRARPASRDRQSRPTLTHWLAERTTSERANPVRVLPRRRPR